MNCWQIVLFWNMLEKLCCVTNFTTSEPEAICFAFKVLILCFLAPGGSLMFYFIQSYVAWTYASMPYILVAMLVTSEDPALQMLKCDS